MSKELFQWDEANRNHIARHRVSCEEAEQVLLTGPLELEFGHINGEERYTSVGETLGRRILVVISTWRDGKIRVITAFDAPHALKNTYMQEKARTHGVHD